MQQVVVRQLDGDASDIITIMEAPAPEVLKDALGDLLEALFGDVGGGICDTAHVAIWALLVPGTCQGEGNSTNAKSRARVLDTTM